MLWGYLATKNGHVDVLEVLEGKPGVDFSAFDNLAACLAAENGRVDVLKFFDGKPGVDFAARDNYAVHAASLDGEIGVLEFLEGKTGVDFSARNNDAARRAARHGSLRVLGFLSKQPGVRMAEYLHKHPMMQKERRAWEDKQDAFVASAERLTMDDVERAVKHNLIFRELEGLAVNGTVRERVAAQIAKEYAEVAWRKGNGRQLLAHWSRGRARRRAGDLAKGSEAGGSDLLRALEGLPRLAVLEVLQQTVAK